MSKIAVSGIQLMMPFLWTPYESRSILVFRQKMDGSLKLGLLLPRLWRQRLNTREVRRPQQNVKITGQMYAFFSYHTDSDPHIILLQLKKNYLQVHKLQNQSGFGWDDGLKMVTASDEVWATYLKVRVRTLLVKIATNNFIGKSQGFSLAQDTIPSVRRYPFPCPWCCCNRW